MKNIIKTIIISPLFCLLILQFIGCTIIGLGIGAISDAKKSDYKTISINELGKVKKSSIIIAVKRNGDQLPGTLLGLEPMNEDEYAEIYNKYRQRVLTRHKVPSLGEISILLIKSGRKLNYILTGFDYDGLILKKSKLTNPSKILFAPLHETEIIDCEGNKIGTNTLERLVLSGEIPVFSSVKIQTLSGDSIVNLSNISQLLIPNKKNGRIKGLLIGAAIDVTTLIILALTDPLSPDGPYLEGFEWEL